jgi:hypothetical protein
MATVLALMAWLAFGCGRVGLELMPPPAARGDAGATEDSSSPVGTPDDVLAHDGDIADVDELCADDDDDGDRRCAADDNCPDAANADQADLDGDGLGDACDDDRDGDGSSNQVDRCPSSAPDDRDGDMICDDVDLCLVGDDRRDADGDGAPDACDACPASALGDSDGDGSCDDVDACPGSDDRVDSDGDGRADGCDACPREATKLAPDTCDCARTPVPLAYWHFDESSGATATDGLGAHHGALRNISGSAWGTGRSGNALSFDGVDDYVSVGALGAPIRSFAFWMRADALGLASAETPWFSPSAHGDIDQQWLAPENAYESDDQYSNAGLGLIDFNAQDWYGFHLVVPTGATVPGILAQVEFNNSNPTCSFGIELSWGAGVTNSYTQTGFESPLAVLNEYLSFGGPSQGWGHTWSAAQLGDALFRLRLTKGGIPGSPMTPGVDHIRVKAFYALNPPGSRQLVLLGAGAQVELTPQGVATPGWPAGTQLFIDGTAGAHLDTQWHHVVVSSPTFVTASDLQIGGTLLRAGFFRGVLDELSVFSETLSLEQARALSDHGECGR